jgi:hypothetical protein
MRLQTLRDRASAQPPSRAAATAIPQGFLLVFHAPGGQSPKRDENPRFVPAKRCLMGSVMATVTDSATEEFHEAYTSSQWT